MLQHSRDNSSSNSNNNCHHHRPELSYIPTFTLKHHCEIYGTIDHVSRTLIFTHFATPKKEFSIFIFCAWRQINSPQRDFVFITRIILFLRSYHKICLHKNFPDILYRPQFISDYVYKYLPKQKRYLRVISSWRFFLLLHTSEEKSTLVGYYTECQTSLF